MKTLEVTGMNANNVSKVVSGLSMLLANLQVHYTNLRNLHWNMLRPYILHDYLDVSYTICPIFQPFLPLLTLSLL